MMAQFGRDAWRRDGETFYGLVRAARAARAVRASIRETGARPAAVVRDRPARGPAGRSLDIVIIGVGTASILFDGLSQTEPWFAVFGAPDVPVKTLQLLGFLGVIVLAAVAVARLVGVSATGAGPPADRRRLPDRPLLHVPADRRPADHRRHRRPAPAGLGPRRVRLGVLRAERRRSCRRASSGRSRSRRSSAGTCSGRGPATSSTWPIRRTRAGLGRRREVPLAVIMVALTTLTLWSLGQTLVVEVEGDQASAVVAGARSRRSRCSGSRRRAAPAARACRRTARRPGRSSRAAGRDAAGVGEDRHPGREARGDAMGAVLDRRRVRAGSRAHHLRGVEEQVRGGLAVSTSSALKSRPSNRSSRPVFARLRRILSRPPLDATHVA